MIGKCKKTLLAASALATGITIYPAIAAAQTGASGLVRENIVVTARKREENLLEVPVAITALTSEDLRSANAFGLEDVAQLTPGLNFSALPGGFAEPTIRGLSQTDQNGLIGNVGVFVDGIYLNNRASVEFGNMDLAQIEVLKGPQSALFGRDTFAGAINYRTNPAVLGEFDAMVEGQLGSDELYSLRGSINIPIGEYFAIRAFAGTSSFDGTIENVRDADAENLGGWNERTTFGGQALFEKGRVRVKLFTLLNEQDEENPPAQTLRFTGNTGGTVYVVDDGMGGTFNIGSLPAGDVPTITSVSVDPRGTGLNGDFKLSYGVIDIDLDFATLSATVSTSESNYDSNYDNFANPENYTRPFFALTPDLSNYFFTNSTGDAAEQDSYEVRLASNEDAPFDWQFGYVRFDSSTGGVLSTTVPLISDINTLETITRVEERIVQEIDAIFGAVNVPVTSRLNIGAEARYTWEDQALTDEAGIFFFPVLSRPLTSTETEFDYWSGRISADYLINDDVMIYGSVARGVKTGGINGGQTGEFATFEPETNTAYELGAKGRLLDDRLVLNAAVFFIDWNDLQSTAPADLRSGAAPFVANGIGDPSSTGIEFDATFDVTEQFQLRLATSWIDATYGDDFTDQALEGFCPANYTPSGVVVGTLQECSATVNDTRLARTPEFTFFASGQYTWPELVKGFDAYARADFSHEGDRYATSQNVTTLPAVNLVNIRAGVQNDKTEVAFWVDNLFDEESITRATTFTDPSDGLVCPDCGGLASLRQTAGALRTFGVTVTQRF